MAASQDRGCFDGEGFTGSTNQGTDTVVREIGNFMRPNLRDGAGQQSATRFMRH